MDFAKKSLAAIVDGHPRSTELAHRLGRFIFKKCLSLEDFLTIDGFIVEALDKSPDCRLLLVEYAAPMMLEMINTDLDVKLRGSVAKCVNNLFRSTSGQFKSKFYASNVARLTDVAKSLKDIGDYEYQLSTLEMLVRICQGKRSEIFSWNLDLSRDFQDLNVKSFEVEARKLLNRLNRSCGDKAKVITLSCLKLLVSERELFKPSSNLYEGFWVDFNLSTNTILVFCDWRDSWNGLTIQSSQIDKASLEIGNNMQTLILDLNVISATLFDSQDDQLFPEKTIKISFAKDVPLTDIISKVFPALTLIPIDPPLVQRNIMASKRCLISEPEDKQEEVEQSEQLIEPEKVSTRQGHLSIMSFDSTKVQNEAGKLNSASFVFESTKLSGTNLMECSQEKTNPPTVATGEPQIEETPDTVPLLAVPNGGRQENENKPARSPYSSSSSDWLPPPKSVKAGNLKTNKKPPKRPTTTRKTTTRRAAVNKKVAARKSPIVKVVQISKKPIDTKQATQKSPAVKEKVSIKQGINTNVEKSAKASNTYDLVEENIDNSDDDIGYHAFRERQKVIKQKLKEKTDEFKTTPLKPDKPAKRPSGNKADKTSDVFKGDLTKPTVSSSINKVATRGRKRATVNEGLLKEAPKAKRSSIEPEEALVSKPVEMLDSNNRCSSTGSSEVLRNASVKETNLDPEIFSQDAPQLSLEKEFLPETISPVEEVVQEANVSVSLYKETPTARSALKTPIRQLPQKLSRRGRRSGAAILKGQTSQSFVMETKIVQEEEHASEDLDGTKLIHNKASGYTGRQPDFDETNKSVAKVAPAALPSIVTLRREASVQNLSPMGDCIQDKGEENGATLSIPNIRRKLLQEVNTIQGEMISALNDHHEKAQIHLREMNQRFVEELLNHSAKIMDGVLNILDEVEDQFRQQQQQKATFLKVAEK